MAAITYREYNRDRTSIYRDYVRYVIKYYDLAKQNPESAKTQCCLVWAVRDLMGARSYAVIPSTLCSILMIVARFFNLTLGSAQHALYYILGGGAIALTIYQYCEERIRLRPEIRQLIAKQDYSVPLYKAILVSIVFCGLASLVFLLVPGQVIGWIVLMTVEFVAVGFVVFYDVKWITMSNAGLRLLK